MHSNHDGFQTLEANHVSQRAPGLQREHSVIVEVPASEVVGHREYPLERVCSYPAEHFQLTFARNARYHLVMREDVEVIASRQGLTIRAENEEALAAAVRELQALYGPHIHLGPLTIRYHKAAALEQPWMGIHVRCAVDYLDAVNADLIARGATIVSCEIEGAKALVEASAPLSTLLGYRTDLERLTEGSGHHAMWLSHYAPVSHLPPDGEAA
jgi:hypothetical protein